MKVVLVQPKMDSVYEQHRKPAYGSLANTPETGLAVLSAWLSEYSNAQPVVRVLNPVTGFETVINESATADFVGLSDWYTNHSTCCKLAKSIKSANPQVKIILGGPNASMLNDLILKNHPYIDYIVGSLDSFDGEETLRCLIDKIPISQTPNLWYRSSDGTIKFTSPNYTDLTKMPLWDFSNFVDGKERLKLYLQNQEVDPWQVPPIALFCFRGCIKAKKEGRCNFCTSSEEGRCRSLPQEIFWQQVCHLNQLYGAKVFYMADDIFTVSLYSMKLLAETKPTEATAKIRAYGYLPYLARFDNTKLSAIAKYLNKIGVFNLFFGSENFVPMLLSQANKPGVSIEETIRIMTILYKEGGIKSTIALLLGLPKESQETLITNLNALKRLFKEAEGAFERLYISIAMPLRGSGLFELLSSSKAVRENYHQQVMRDLSIDDYPDYKVLVKLMLEYFTETDPAMIMSFMDSMTQEASQHIPQHKIGGFMLDL